VGVPEYETTHNGVASVALILLNGLPTHLLSAMEGDGVCRCFSCVSVTHNGVFRVMLIVTCSMAATLEEESDVRTTTS
jgi:hypothetical protein